MKKLKKSKYSIYGGGGKLSPQEQSKYGIDITYDLGFPKNLSDDRFIVQPSKTPPEPPVQSYNDVLGIDSNDRFFNVDIKRMNNNLYNKEFNEYNGASNQQFLLDFPEEEDYRNYEIANDRQVNIKYNKFFEPDYNSENRMKYGGKIPKYSKWKYSLGGDIGMGFASGAATGALAGAPAGGIGAIPGAIIGGIGGAISGLAKGLKEKKQADLLKEQNKPQSLLPTYNSNPYGNSFANGGELIKYNVGTHASGKDQMVNKMGLPTNNPNDAVGKVQKQETIQDGFVFSDDLGYTKKGFPTLNTKEVKNTFADKSKKIEKKFEGRKDELAMQTKNLMMSNIQKDNQKLLDIKEEQNKIKAIKALGRFEKKYGGTLGKYPLGGDLVNDPFGFEHLQDNILGKANWQPYTTNNIETGVSSASDQYNFANSIIPKNSAGLKGINGESVPNIPMQYSNINIATMPLKDRYNEYSSLNKASAQTSPKITSPSSIGSTNPADYISPALNAGFALYNAFKKPKNYLPKPNNQAIEDVNQIETEPDNSQLYNRNVRTLKAANVNAGNASPSIRNSLMSNNFANKLNADNEIGFNTQKERLDRIQAKQSLKAQIHANQNQWGEAAKSQYFAENAADRQANQEAVMTNLSNAVNDISKIGRDKELLTIYKQGLKYFDYDTKTGKFIYKNTNGDVFYSSVPPQGQ